MKINSMLLKGMLAAAPKNDVRYYLNGVHVKDGVIEASNGHYLFRAQIESKEEMLFTLVGNIPARSDVTELDFDTKIATHKDIMECVLGVSYIKSIDGKFPDTVKVIEQFSPCSVDAIGYNPQYLGLPYKLFKVTEMKLEFSGGADVARGSFSLDKHGADVRVEMYIMPLKL